MADPITTPDLYAPSTPTTPEEKPLTPKESGLTYEETPVVEPQPPPAPEAPAPPAPPPSKPKRSSFLGVIGNLLLFIVLFGVGMWLATFLRQYLPTGFGGPTTPQEEITPMPRGKTTPTPPVTSDSYRGWQTYQVISSATKQPIGISFKLPADVLSPICDGTSCMSQGTYLPGGTRFTVALRGPGMALRDFRGRIITDVNGTEFTTSDTTVVGRAAINFTGTFNGRTVAGYAFTRMHGYMIEVSDTLSLEINHFTPSGIAADFAADHTLFESVVKSLTFEGYPTTPSKGAAMPVLTPQTTPATSSGY